MFPKIRQVAKETFMPKKAAQERGDSIRQRYFGEGTYNPITKSDVTNQSSLRGIGMDAHSRSQTSYSGPSHMASKRRRDAGEKPPGF